MQDKVAIEENDNAGKIHDELMLKGAQLVRRTVDMILEDKIEAVAQREFYNDETELKAAPKIFKDTCRIDWNQSAEKIHNHIRGLSPYPAAWTELCVADKDPLMVKIFKSKFLLNTEGIENGKIISDSKEFMHITCKNGAIVVDEILLAGKKRMKVIDFLKGYKLEEGSCFK